MTIIDWTRKIKTNRKAWKAKVANYSSDEVKNFAKNEKQQTPLRWYEWFTLNTYDNLTWGLMFGYIPWTSVNNEGAMSRTLPLYYGPCVAWSDTFSFFMFLFNRTKEMTVVNFSLLQWKQIVWNFRHLNKNFMTYEQHER